MHRRYLRDAFVREAEAAGLTAASTVYEVDQPVIRRRGAQVRCPRDGRPGAAYVDCLADGDAGRSDVMLSYTWSYSVGSIAAGLTDYCAKTGRDPSATYTWICCLCCSRTRTKYALCCRAVSPLPFFWTQSGS